MSTVNGSQLKHAMNQVHMKENFEEEMIMNVRTQMADGTYRRNSFKRNMASAAACLLVIGTVSIPAYAGYLGLRSAITSDKVMARMQEVPEAEVQDIYNMVQYEQRSFHADQFSTESNADVMAADVQQTGLLEDSADSGSGGDSGITPQESGQSSVLPPLSTEAQTIDYKGSVPVDWLTASSDAIYLLSRDQDGGSGILKMKPGEADGEALQVTAPDGMTFSVMTTDEQGNLYVVAEDKDIEETMRDDEVVCPTEHCEVWRVSPSGEVTAKLDISEYVKKEVFSPRMIAVAGNGDIYLSTQVDGTAVLAFNAEGNFLNKISYDYKVYSLRTAMGRGRDGKVYAVLRDSVADDGTSVIVELDGRDGHIGDATSFMLRSDGSFYSNVCPGRDCDLVIFGGEGILGYDLGSANIKWKVPAGKLPFSTEGFYPMAALADGRILFLDSNKLHYVPAAQQ